MNPETETGLDYPTVQSGVAAGLQLAVIEAEIYALTQAVLGLVEAQEAANEQARIGNLIAYRAGILFAALLLGDPQ